MLILLAYGFRNQYWLRLWEFARYLLAFIMVNSAISKFYFGGIFQKDQMTNILLAQHTDILALAPQTLQSQFIQFLLTNSTFTNGIYYMAVLLQFVFIIAFFTKKYEQNG